jgi:hypothetical protein
MPNPSDLRPRPLWNGELPVRGDLHFAVGFGPKSALVSRIIAVGTASRTNHVGVITAVSPPDSSGSGQWKIVESLADGVVEDIHRPPPNSTVIRVSENPDIREELASKAEEGAHPHHIAYDWSAIARIVFVGLVGRIPFLTFPILAGPPLARFVNPIWVPIVVTVAAIVVLYWARGWLFRFTMACPWPKSDLQKRAICSAFARETIQSVFTPAALPGLAQEPIAITSPGDLLQELLHRCDYWTAVPRRAGVLDAPIRDRPKVTVTRVE